MKKLTLLLFGYFIYLFAGAQTDQWTWMGGDSSIYPHGAYGTRGIADASSQPGGRETVASCTDNNGDFWLFGGAGVGATGGSYGFLNDLWKYSPSTRQWTWVSGDSLAVNHVVNQSYVYGTKGVAAAANKPGARYGASSWSDDSGNIWLFGGTGFAAGSVGYLNDLWMYSPATGLWTWISGDNFPDPCGIYGTKGVAAASGNPGGRMRPATWTDKGGNFWLFGGDGNASGHGGSLNDLWKYNISTGLWTWMSGDSTAGQTGVYGTIGAEAASNKPGGRSVSFSWMDAGGHLWLFGGGGFAASTYGNLNDLWKYNPSTGQWAWMSGDNAANLNGVYGTQGVAAASNKPGGRIGPVSWTDTNGNFWLSGGSGYAATGAEGYLNDLWKYSPSAGLWTWIGGDNTAGQQGVYGTKGVAAASNKLGARYVSAGWRDRGGNFWLFGGYGNGAGAFGYFNDLWVYGPARTITITSLSGTAFCQNGPVFLTFEANSAYDTGNIFAAQLSDSAGSFAAPVAIGAVSATAAGSYTINATIPAATTPGTAYRIRVVSANPAHTSLDNGTDITVRQSNELGGCDSSRILLPVTRLRFAAQPQGGANLLGWTTTTESNNRGFEVQGAPDGLIFTTLGFVGSKAAGGNSSGRLAYSFIHHSPSGSVQYYRLRQVDRKGNESLSPVVMVRRETTGGPAIFRVYPNPAEGVINLQLSASRAGSMTLEVSDLVGRPMRRVQQVVKEGINTLWMDLPGLPPGIYLLRVVAGAGVQGPAVKVLLK